MKKLLTLLMAVLLVLTATMTMLVLVSCSDDSSDDRKPNGPDVPGESDKPTEERIPLDLPEKNYETGEGKTTFNMLQWTVANQTTPGEHWMPWEEGDVEEEDGDMLGGAVFRRNAWVEENFGVEITTEYASLDIAPSFTQRVITNASTSANEFQLMTLRTYDIFTLIQENMYLDMNQYAGTILHTDQPWWVQDSIDSFTLGSHLYVASSEMLLRDKGSTAALYFNQELAKDYAEELPNFFEIAENKEWTFEAMLDACEVVASSADGDQEMNSSEDIWGCFGGDDPTFLLFNGMGFKFAHVDDFGYIEYDYGKGDSLVVMQDIFEKFMFAEWYLNAGVNGKDILGEGEEPFVNGQVLFKSGMVKDTTTTLRQMKELYGILPHPMLDDNQENYSSLVWVHHDSVVGIPAHVNDPEMSAVILEALSWESYYSVYPVFYDTILLSRAAKDEESKRMLELIFDSRSYDPGQYYDTGTSASGLQGDDGLLRLAHKGTADIAGMWAGFKPLVDANIEQVNKWVAGNED